MTKIGLRNTWFQVHKWIGLVLAVAIIPLSVTGAALVWDQALDHILNPQRYAISGAQPVAVDRYVEAARKTLAPGEKIATIAQEEGGPVVVAANQPRTAARGGPPARTFLWFDPSTVRLLDQSRGGGLIRAFHVIHGSLMIPGVGRQIVGWIGVAMTLSCLTGLWLWWPVVGRWARGLRWRRHRNLDANLHHLLGFWIVLPLFVLSVTGVLISFPQLIAGQQQQRPGGGASQGRPQPLAAPVLSASRAVILAQAQHPGDWRSISWPTDRKPQWQITFADARVVGVDDIKGTARLSPASPETTARLIRRIHDGSRMGFVWQFIIFLGGLIPAALAVTGIIMWWRARGWKADLKARQEARTVV